jgi:hypothetical protein
MEDFLNRLLQEYLERKVKERKGNIFYPSEIPQCLRRTWYFYKKPKKLTFELLKLFQAGNLVHNFLISVFLNSFQRDKIQFFDYEGKVRYTGKNFEIIGRYDDVVMININDEPKLFELKTARNLEFIKEVKPHHFSQINFYLKQLGLEKGWVVYIDRRNLNIRVFEINFSEEKFQELVKRAEILWNHLKENKLPVAEAKVNKSMSWACRYCSFLQECEKDEV